MPGLKVQVALSEALEVRAGPLTEAELWGLLCQAAEALQDIFLTGRVLKFLFICLIFFGLFIRMFFLYVTIFSIASLFLHMMF